MFPIPLKKSHVLQRTQSAKLRRFATSLSGTPWGPLGWAIVCTAALSSSGYGQIPESPREAASPDTAFSESATLSEFVFGGDNGFDQSYEAIQRWKKTNHIPITIGAHHWFHFDRDQEILGDGYGGNGLDGTYFWFIKADPKWTLDSGPFQEIGAHVELRIRDGNDKFRPFVAERFWTFESFIYGKSEIGTFKVGQMLTRFGLPWDGTWWEGVPYFDGFSFDPDYGVGWENRLPLGEQLSIEASLQYFLNSDDVNGSINGADAESAPGANEENTFVLRLVPSFEFDNGLRITWGFSALYGDIGGANPLLDDERYAFGTDMSLSYGPLGAFIDYVDSHGAVHPNRYVSGGASDRVNSLRFGASYQVGPVTTHASFSKGWDHNPDGHQDLWNLGFTTQVAKNTTLYVEYVNWDVTNSSGRTTKFEDGFQVVLVWSL